jgi:hypothetical protein
MNPIFCMPYFLPRFNGVIPISGIRVFRGLSHLIQRALIRSVVSKGWEAALGLILHGSGLSGEGHQLVLRMLNFW